MSSFAAKKTRVFRDAGDAQSEIGKKRSDGRMKVYPSATDVRAWGTEREDRRQYILDLVRGDHGKGLTLGKYVPIEVLIDTLLANKNADIAKLREQVDELKRLLACYEQLDLTPEQRAQLDKLKREIGKVGSDLDKQSSRYGGSRKSGGKYGGGTSDTDGDIGESTTSRSASPDGKGGRTSGDSDTSAKARAVEAEKAAKARAVEAEKAAKAKAEEEERAKQIGAEGSSVAETAVSGSVAGGTTGADGASSRKTDTGGTIGDGVSKSGDGVSKSGAGVTGADGASSRKSGAGGTSGEDSSAGSSSSDGAPAGGMNRSILPGMGRAAVGDSDGMPNDIDALKKLLAEKRADCEKQRELARKAIEKLETLKDIIEERDKLKKKLEDSEHELAEIKARGGFSDSSKAKSGKVKDPTEDLEAMEREIEELRAKGELTPEQETEVMRKELAVLKKYCDKLSNIQDENMDLKRERDALKSQIARLQGVPVSLEDDKPVDINDYKQQVALLERKVALLNDITAERDRLQTSVTRLEKELEKFSNLPEDVTVFKERSRMLDELLEERESLHQRLSRMKGLEDEIIALKKKANLADELQRQLDALRAEMARLKNSSSAQLLAAKDGKDSATKEIENLRSDKQKSDQELERLRYRVKEADVLRIERDRLKARLDELGNIEAEYLELAKKMSCFDSIKRERDEYKKRCEELDRLECECNDLKARVNDAKEVDKEVVAMRRRVAECDCVIADQENEINALVTHIDQLTEGNDQQQERMKVALGEMRVEIDQKNSLIAASEDQIAGVQDQLKCTIKDVCNDSEALVRRANELEKSLLDKEHEIEELKTLLKEKQEQIDFLQGQMVDKDDLLRSVNQERRSSLEMSDKVQNKDAAIEKMKNELAELKAENDRLQQIASRIESMTDNEPVLEKMMEKSKHAVDRVSEELGKRYTDWDCMQGKTLRTGGETDMRKLRDELEDLREKMQRLQKELDEANATIEQLKSGLNNTERTVAENQALRRHSSEIQEVAKDQIQDLVDHLKKANDKIAELEQELRELRSKTTGDVTDSESIDELRKQLQQVQSEKDKLQSYIDSLEKQSNAESSNSEAKYKELKEQLEKEIRRRQEAESKATENEKQLLDALKQLEDMKKRMEDEKKRMEDEKKQLEDEKKQMSEGQSSKSVENTDLKRQLEEMNKKLANSVENDSKLSSENSDLKKQLEDLKKQVEDLKKQLNESKSFSSGKETELKSENSELQKQLNELKSENSELQKQLNEMKQRLAELSAQNSNLEKKLEEAEKLSSNTSSTLANEVAELKKDINKLNDKITALNKEIADQNKEIADLNKEIADLNKKMADMQLKLNDTSALDALEDERDKLLKQIDSQKAEILDLLSKSKSASAAEDQLSLAQRDKDEKEKKALQDIINDLEKQLRQMGEEEMKQAENKGMDDKLKELERQLAEQQAKADAAEQEVNKLKTEKALAVSDDADANILALQDSLDKETKQRKKTEEEMQQLRDRIKELENENAALKKLAERQDKDLKASKDSIVVHTSQTDSEKAKLLDKIKKLEDQLAKKSDDCKDELEKQKKEFNDTIAALKAQYDRDIKNLHNRHNDSVSKLQTAHEEIVSQTSKGHEKQVDDLRDELLRCKCNMKMQEDKNAEKKPAELSANHIGVVNVSPKSKESLRGVPVIKEGLQDDPMLDSILIRALDEGLEELTFEELQYMHTQVCDATARVLEHTSNSGGVQRESKIVMLRRNVPPSNPRDITQRQRQAQEIISKLQHEINSEKKKLFDLKQTLDQEKDTNIELIRRIQSQSKAVSNMQTERDIILKKNNYHQDKINKYSESIQQEKVRVRQLEEALQKERVNNQQLKSRLDHSGQEMENDNLDRLRLELNKALNSEMVLKMQMEQTSSRSPPKSATVVAVPINTGNSKPRIHTSTFYTELTVENTNDLNRMQMKRIDRGNRSPPSRDYEG